MPQQTPWDLYDAEAPSPRDGLGSAITLIIIMIIFAGITLSSLFGA